MDLLAGFRALLDSRYMYRLRVQKNMGLLLASAHVFLNPALRLKWERVVRTELPQQLLKSELSWYWNRDRQPLQHLTPATADRLLADLQVLGSAGQFMSNCMASCRDRS